jgi:hypothetical protein
MARSKQSFGLGSGLGSAVRDVGIVGVKRVAHSVTSELDRVADVGGVYVF